MTNKQNPVALFLALGKTQSVLARRFDAGLGGVSLTELMILSELNEAADGRMRRIDLAEKVGLTPSGITRLLAPMEKIGLVKREAYAEDARVSQVMLAPGGKRKLEEGMERAEALATDLLSSAGIKAIDELTETIRSLGKVRL